MTSGENFRLERLPEPHLKFGDGEKAKDPRAGLLKYGPATVGDGDYPDIAKIGIVGDDRSISLMERLLDNMRGVVESTKKRRRWKPPFPGLGKSSPLKFDYNLLDKWKGRIQQDEIETIADLPNREDRIEFAFNNIRYQIENVCNQTPSPDVVFVTIPERIVELCSDPHTDTGKITTQDGDFHNRLKLTGMKNNTPTQLMSPNTLDDARDVQERSEVAWNVAVGMLYKARRGRPWKLGKLRSNTCYAGISFFKDEESDADMRASVAQVFIPDGTHFVIRGDPVEDISEDEPQAHLGFGDAKRLVEQILENYGNHMDDRPDRLVLHKTSNFHDTEAKGFAAGANDVGTKEFITIRKHHPLRVFPPSGDYPVLRGTLIIPPGEREYYLYTRGYVPEISAYRDPGSPNPIVIRPHDKYFSGDYRRVTKEILSFTKLDWNSSDFSVRLPVTIGISQSVSDILAEPDSNEVNLQTHYYYYM